MVGLLLALPFASAAQRGWQMTIQISPLAEQTNYPRRVLYPNSNGQIVEPIYLSGRHWATGVQGGFTAQYGFEPGWSVSAGVGYRQFSTRQARFGNDGTTTINSRAIRVPLLLNFQSSQNRLSPYFTVGTLFDFPLSSRVTVRGNDRPAQQLILDVNDGLAFYLMAGAGVKYQLSNRYALAMQPVVNFKAGQLGDTRSYDRAVEVGLQTQVSYSF